MKKLLVIIVFLTTFLSFGLMGCQSKVQSDVFIADDELAEFSLSDLPEPPFTDSRVKKNAFLSVTTTDEFDEYAADVLDYFIENQDVTYFGWRAIVSYGFIGIGISYDVTPSSDLTDYRETVANSGVDIGYSYIFYFTTEELEEDDSFKVAYYIIMTHYDEERTYDDIDKQYEYNFYLSVGKVLGPGNITYTPTEAD